MNRPCSVSTRRVETGTLYFVALLREELGRRIATARIASGLSQRELADRIGLKNASDVSRYERGIVEVSGPRIDLIAEATGRPRSYFTRDPAEPEPSLNGGLSEDAEARLLLRLDELAEGIDRILRMLADRPASDAKRGTQGARRR